MTSGIVDLFTSEQAHVCDLPLHARVIVDAAAGTGKTHVLAGRLDRLINRDGLSAGDEVLVLSFSRAAVAELRGRVDALGGDARYVGAQTFDAFATRLLATEVPDDSWLTSGYDQRIRRATDLLRQTETPQLLMMVQHVLVDEIQDLVGIRAQMVMELLSKMKGGFTLFGDPAQAIYGHQLEADGGGPSNPELYRWVTEHFGDGVSRCSLTQDFRGRTNQAIAITDIGMRLRGTDPDHSVIASDIRTVLLKLPTTTIGAARRVLTGSRHGSSAVLCRTNAQALRISHDLFERGIPHRYQRRGEDRAAAGWLSRAFSGVSEMRTTRSSLQEPLERIAEEQGSTVDELFMLIRKLDPVRGDGVNLQGVAHRVRESAFPEELNEVVACPTVVSTVHRAKGLEFDRVVLCDFGERDVADIGEENRLSYVALTRARREIFHTPAPDTAGLWIDRRSGRWVRRGWGSNRWKLYEVEVVGPDSDAVHPAGTWHIEGDVCALQQYLTEAVNPGDPVDLVLVPPGPRGAEIPHFVVRHGEREVAVTSEAFGSVLRDLLGSTPPPPLSIAGLHVEMVDTVAGDATLGRGHGLGAHGIWARVRVFGLGTLNFDRIDAGKD